MPEQQLEAGQVHEAQEVLDVVFPAGDETTEVLHPEKPPLDFPPPAIAAQRSSILGLAARPPVGRDHLDAVFGLELLVERVGIVGLVADEPGGRWGEEASGRNFLHKLTLGWRSTLHRYGERKTVASGDSDDFRALAAARGADGKPPFLALAKVPSTNASSRFSCPRWCSFRAKRCSASSNCPLRTHCWNRRWQVWKGGFFSGTPRHCAPVPKIHSTPFNTARVSCQGRPRWSTRRRGRSTGSTTAHCSSVSSQRPLISACRDRQSTSSMPPICPLGVYETGSSLRFRNSLHRPGCCQ